MKLLKFVAERLYFFPLVKPVTQTFDGLVVTSACLHQENGNSSMIHLPSLGFPTFSMEFVFHCTFFLTRNAQKISMCIFDRAW